MAATPSTDPHRSDRDGGTDARPLVAIYRTVLINYNEVYLRTEVEALRRYRSFYVGTRRPSGGVELPEDRTLTLREGFRGLDRWLDPVVEPLGRRLAAVAPLAPVGRALAAGRLVGRASEYLFLVHGISPTLVRALRARRPALVHAYTGVSGAHALPLARELRVPLVVTFGGTDATGTDDVLRHGAMHGELFIRRREAMKREVQLVIAASAFLRDTLVERGWPAERIVVRTRGVDTTVFTPDGSPPIAERAPIVFFAGRLLEVKGVTYLLQAMAEVRRRVPQAELVVAGSGPLREPLEAEARRLGDRARFLGSVTPEQIRACLAEAQVYCMPSVSASTGQVEGLPNALLEAMAAGVPVVGSASGGIPQAIGDAGFLVPERDVAALADRLCALLGDADLRARAGVAARQRILERFDLRRQSSELEALYDRARAEFAERHGAGR